MPLTRVTGSAATGAFLAVARCRQQIQRSLLDPWAHLKTASGRRTPESFNATLYRDSSGAIRGIFAVARALAQSGAVG